MLEPKGIIDDNIFNVINDLLPLQKLVDPTEQRKRISLASHVSSHCYFEEPKWNVNS